MPKVITPVRFAALLFFQAIATTAAAADEGLVGLSLEELLNIEVSTGSLLKSSTDDAPAAITIIRKDQIEISSAKNLANLLEQHVPGMMLMSHSEGDKIGLRGLIAAENYKLLLLVNGKNITNMVYEGAILEIDQWDMGDIERVEVIRGPGSVTYGTGAIAGIINIITKTPHSDSPAFSVGLASNNTYQSRGINAQFNKSVNQFGAYGFLSYRKTDGYQNPDYFAMSPSDETDIRFVGKRPTDTLSPQAYLADGVDRPQIKAHLGLEYGENFSSWLRYTQSGQTRFFTQQRAKEDAQGNVVGTVNRRSPSTRSLAFSTTYNLVLSDVSNVASSLTYDSQEYIRHDYLNPRWSLTHENNVRDYGFAQNRLRGSVLYEYTPDDKFNIVAGYEYVNIDVHAPWGKSSDHLLIQEGVHFVSDVDSSVYLQDLTLNNRTNPDRVLEVGSGINSETHSLLLETRFNVSERNQLFYAHRVDFPDVAETMFSPRLSWVNKVNPENTFVATVQRAQRMMPLRAQYQNHLMQEDSKLETLDGVEVSYTNRYYSNASLNVRSFYNDISAVGFTGSNLEFLTDVKIGGVEFTGSYATQTTELTLSHAYLGVLDVAMNESLKTGASRNNISFADYYYMPRGDIPVLLEGYGNGLNNVVSHTSKFLISKKFLNNRLIAHANAQIFWDFDGSYDEMEMYQRAYDTFNTAELSAEDLALFTEQKRQFERERYLLDKTDSYKLDYALNVSLSYTHSLNKKTDVRVKLFAENILHSKNRYNVSTGSSRFYPERFNFMVEPVAIGMSVTLDLN